MGDRVFYNMGSFPVSLRCWC